MENKILMTIKASWTSQVPDKACHLKCPGRVPLGNWEPWRPSLQSTCPQGTSTPPQWCDILGGRYPYSVTPAQTLWLHYTAHGDCIPPVSTATQLPETLLQYQLLVRLLVSLLMNGIPEVQVTGPSLVSALGNCPLLLQTNTSSCAYRRVLFSFAFIFPPQWWLMPCHLMKNNGSKIKSICVISVKTRGQEIVAVPRLRSHNS